MHIGIITEKELSTFQIFRWSFSDLLKLDSESVSSWRFGQLPPSSHCLWFHFRSMLYLYTINMSHVQTWGSSEYPLFHRPAHAYMDAYPCTSRISTLIDPEKWRFVILRGNLQNFQVESFSLDFWQINSINKLKQDSKVRTLKL